MAIEPKAGAESDAQARVDRGVRALRAKYPKHIIAVCANGKISRRVPRRYLTGKGSANHGRGKIVVRNVLEAVYDPETYVL